MREFRVAAEYNVTFKQKYILQTTSLHTVTFLRINKRKTALNAFQSARRFLFTIAAGISERVNAVRLKSIM